MNELKIMNIDEILDLMESHIKEKQEFITWLQTEATKKGLTPKYKDMEAVFYAYKFANINRRLTHLQSMNIKLQ